MTINKCITEIIENDVSNKYDIGQDHDQIININERPLSLGFGFNDFFNQMRSIIR